jgi:cysteine desulfurase
MTEPRTYLDWNASAPLRLEAREAMLTALEAIGNPSSVHTEGRRARALIEDARERVAALVGAKPAEVVFTSGATEANNWAMAGWTTIFVSAIEHDSVLAPAHASGARIVELPASSMGVVSPQVIAEHVLRETAPAGRGLLALQMANNETGVLQPVVEAAAFAREHGLLTHTDATQAVGRVPVDIRALGVDLLSLSSHKLGGPKGVGALIVREGCDIAPFVRGGGQERRRRAGTENVAAIAGFGAAAAAAADDLARIGAVAANRDRIERGLKRITPDAVVIGESAERLANTTCIALPGKLAETLVIQLDLAGIAVSAGSACSSGKVGTSRVLAAMGVPAEVARSAIRLSVGASTSRRDVERLFGAWMCICGSRAIEKHLAGDEMPESVQLAVERILEEV